MVYEFLNNAETEEQVKVLGDMLVESIEYGMKRKGRNISKEDAEVIAKWLMREDMINFEPFYYDANEYFKEKQCE